MKKSIFASGKGQKVLPNAHKCTDACFATGKQAQTDVTAQNVVNPGFESCTELTAEQKELCIPHWKM